MKTIITVGSVLVLVATSVAQAQVPLGATNIAANDVKQFLAQLPKDAVSDRPIRVVDVGGYRVGVYGVFRPASVADAAIFHETKVTEIYYILEGSATLVTGGTLREPVTRQKATTSSVMINVRSTNGVEGGVSQPLGKGDIAIIPAGVVHWWSRRDGDLTYLIIRSDPENELDLK